MFILYIIVFIVIVYAIFFIAQFINIVLRGYAPLINTKNKTIDKILREIKVVKPTVIYELGCGSANFLKIAQKHYPQAKLVGIENLFSIYFINKIKFKLLAKRIKLINSDFLKINLKEANIIYCYLNNKTMQTLGNKFKAECSSGTQIISHSFPIVQLNVHKIIEIDNRIIYYYII